MKRLLLALALLLAPSSAGAHSWYERDCCDEQDCRPSPAGEVTVVPGGYEYRFEGTGPVEFFPIGHPRVRNSLDNQFHACPQKYNPSHTHCLYVPGGSM